MAAYLHYAHAVGLERLRLLMAELFGLTISEGALCNMLARAQAPLAAAARPIADAVAASRVVCCDETGARVAGKTWWEWVFATGQGVLHMIRPSRGKQVVRDVLGEARPEVWVSDALPSQRGHAERWQWCFAHALRDVQYAIAAATRPSPPRSSCCCAPPASASEDRRCATARSHSTGPSHAKPTGSAETAA